MSSTDKDKELIDKAISLRESEKYEEALLAARSAVSHNPESADGWWQVGLNYESLKNLDSAIDAYKKTVELSDEFEYGWVTYGKALRNAGRKMEAISALEKAIELSPTRSDALIQLMAIYDGDEENKEKFHLYLKTYDEVHGLTYNNYINSLGNYYYSQNNNHLALACYKRIFDEPNFPYSRHNAGLAYSNMNQTLNALDVWYKNLKMYSDYEPSRKEYLLKTNALEKNVSLIPDVDKRILQTSEWYKFYVNPFELLEVDDGVALHDIEPKVLQAYRKKLIQEIDLEDGYVSWLENCHLDKSRAIGICDELNNSDLFTFHAIVFKFKPLLNFLSRGDINFFMIEPDDDLLEFYDELSWDKFAEWLSIYFPKQFDLIFKKIIHTHNILLYQACLSGRLWVSDSHVDECFLTSRSELSKLLEPLRQEEQNCEKIKPSVQKISKLIEDTKLVEKIKSLPVQFVDMQENAAKLLRSIAISAMNKFDDSEGSKQILEMSRKFTSYNSAIQQKIEEDTRAINKIIADEKKDESTLLFSGKESWIKKDGAKHNDIYIPVESIESLRWGSTVTRENYNTTYRLSMVIRGASQTINLSWNASSETDKSKELFDKHVNALLTYLFPPLMARIKAKIAQGVYVVIGTCRLTVGGIQFETKGWFSNTIHNVPWAKVKAELKNGELVIFSIDNYSDKTTMPLQDTENAFALFLLATSDER